MKLERLSSSSSVSKPVNESLLTRRVLFVLVSLFFFFISIPIVHYAGDGNGGTRRMGRRMTRAMTRKRRRRTRTRKGRRKKKKKEE